MKRRAYPRRASNSRSIPSNSHSRRASKVSVGTASKVSVGIIAVFVPLAVRRYRRMTAVSATR
jgi:hypothetical protein